jgi:DNA-directed RNA polymerase specialized sigma24 family protein
MKVQRKLPEYDQSKAAIGTWVFTITRNTVIDHFRRSRPTEELDENLADSSELINFTRQLLARRYSERDIQKIWGGNFLRVMSLVQKNV